MALETEEMSLDIEITTTWKEKMMAQEYECEQLVEILDTDMMIMSELFLTRLDGWTSSSESLSW